MFSEKRPLVGIVLLLLCVSSVQAQEQPTLTASMKTGYDQVKEYVLRASKAIPEAILSFKPTPEVRTVAQEFGHLANTSYMLCSAVGGQARPSADYEKVTSKAELERVIAASFEFCDAAWAGVTDGNAAAPAKFLGRPSTKLAVLAVETAHLNEHYGKIVTEMRIKGLVPPSSSR